MIRRVTIISYGTGNLSSLVAAIESVGAVCRVAAATSDLVDSDALVLPGVGHFNQAMRYLQESGMLLPTLEMIRNGVPTLGVCLGLQLLTHSSEEAPGVEGLGLLPFSAMRMRPMDTKRFKVPQLGWNKIYRSYGESRLLSGIPENLRVFYYANAYGIGLELNPRQPYATFFHGSEHIALIEHGTLFGVQFHPEKSREQGLLLLKNFLNV
jgi:imidazole glycerol phosphate synthase glutamine amidotransferase subunit